MPMTLTVTHRKMIVFLVVSFTYCFATLAFGQKTNWTTQWNSNESFIENKGQFSIPGQSVASTDILYAIDDGNTCVFFTKTGVTFSLVDMNKRKKTEEEKT